MNEVSHTPVNAPQEDGVEFRGDNTAISADALQDWQEQAVPDSRIPRQGGAPAADSAGGGYPTPDYMGGALTVRRRVLAKGLLGSAALPSYFMGQAPLEKE